MAGDIYTSKEVYEGTICGVDRDGAEEPAFFIYIRATENTQKRELIDSALNEAKESLVRAENIPSNSDTVFIASVDEKSVRCYVSKALADGFEIYLLDEGKRVTVSQDNLFVCPETVKKFDPFCCMRSVLVDGESSTQIEVAKALDGFKCRYIGVSSEIRISEGKPYGSGMVLVEYGTGSFSDIRDIGTKPVKGRECPQFTVEVDEGNLVSGQKEEVNNNSPETASSDVAPQCEPDIPQEIPEKAPVITVEPEKVVSSNNADTDALLPDMRPAEEMRNEWFWRASGIPSSIPDRPPRRINRRRMMYDESRTRFAPNNPRRSGGFYHQTRTSGDKKFDEVHAVPFGYPGVHDPYDNLENYSLESHGGRYSRYDGNNRRRETSSWNHGDNDGNNNMNQEPFLRQKTFKEFEPPQYPCKMRMRFGRKEPGIRVDTFWIIDTVTFTNVERVLHEGRVRYRQTPGFGLSQVHELVGMGCLASVFMDEIFILARAVITSFCEETCSFSIYLVDYGFYKTTKLKDLIDVSHINKLDPILTLPLSMLRCQLDSSSPLMLMDLERGCEYEFEIVTRKGNGIYLVNADQLRNEDPIVRATPAAKENEITAESPSPASNQIVPEYESIVKMLESRIDMLGNNMMGSTTNSGWLHGNTVFNNTSPNVMPGMGYNSFACPFPYWTNQFGYAMPMFMPLVMPMTQQNVSGDAAKVPKEENQNANQATEQQRRPQNVGGNVDQGATEVAEGSYNIDRKWSGENQRTYLRGAPRGGFRKEATTNDTRRTFHKSQSGDFSRERPRREFRSDFGEPPRRFGRKDDKRSTFSFGNKDNEGDKRSEFGFASRGKGQYGMARKRNTAPSFFGKASSEWDLPTPGAPSEEVDAEGKKRNNEAVQFF